MFSPRRIKLAIFTLIILSVAFLAGAGRTWAFSVDIKKLYYADNLDSATLKRVVNYDFSGGTLNGNTIIIPESSVTTRPLSDTGLTYIFLPYPDPENDISVALDTNALKATLTSPVQGGCILNTSPSLPDPASAVPQWEFSVQFSNFTGLTDTTREYSAQIGLGSETAGPHPEFTATWMPGDNGRQLILRAEIYNDSTDQTEWSQTSGPISALDPATTFIELRIRTVPMTGYRDMIFEYRLSDTAEWIQTGTYTVTPSTPPLYLSFPASFPFVALDSGDDSAAADYTVLNESAPFTAPSYMTTDGISLYVVTDNGTKLQSLPLTGGTGTPLYTIQGALQVTVTGDNLYWTDPNSGPYTDTQIWKVSKDGNGTPAAIYTESDISGVQDNDIVDGSGLCNDGTRLYAADEFEGRVVSMNPDGSDRIRLDTGRYTASFATEHINTIAFADGTLYIAASGRGDASPPIPPGVYSIPATGGAFSTICEGSPFVSPSDIAVSADTIYVADSGANTIWKLPRTGGTVTDLVPDSTFTQVMGIELFGNILFATDQGSGLIYAINLTPATGTMSFSGAVSAMSGYPYAPISDATVSLVNDPSLATTTVDGMFSLQNIPAGSPFAVRISKTGYIDVYSGWIDSTQGNITAQRPYMMMTTAEADASPWNISWTDRTNTGMILGAVLDTTNSPYTGIAGVTISAVDVNSPEITYPVAYTGGGTATAADGAYFIFNVPDMTTVRVILTPINGYDWWFTEAPATVHAGAITEESFFGTATATSPLISGQVDTGTSGYTSGNIFIGAYNGPDPGTATLLDSDIIASIGDTYSLYNLPLDTQVYIWAFWDKDGNGVLTPGDYVGTAGSVTVTSEGVTPPVISLDTEYAVQGGSPYFAAATVLAVNTPSGVQTAFSAQIIDPDGSLPGSIASFTVAAPEGTTYTLTAADFSAPNNYYQSVSGILTEGEYAFTFTDTEGNAAVTYAYFKPGDTTIPLPDAASFQASGDPLMPTLSWSAVSGFEGNLFYRARIFDMTSNTIWTSDLSPGTTAFVPSGILQQGISYQWRVEAFDGYHFYASDRRTVSAKIPLTINTTRPFFAYALAQKRSDNGTISLALEASVADPDGSLTGSIASIIVTAPDGASYNLQPTDFDGTSYYHKFSGVTPLTGIYTFTVTDINDNSATSCDYMQVLDIPVVDPGTLQASGDPLAPVLSWAAPAQMDRPLYFRARIYDSSGATVWSSGRIPETLVQVPSGILQSGVSYTWHVRAEDASNGIHTSNQSRTPMAALTIDNSRPFFQYGGVFKRNAAGVFYTVLEARVYDPDGTLPGTIASLTVAGPNGFNYAFQPADFYPADNVYNCRIDGRPEPGIYTFTITDANSNTAVTHDILMTADDIPPPDQTSVLISGDQSMPTISWSGISGYAGRLYYRIRVRDSLGNTVYKSSREPFTALGIPPGILQAGQAYDVRIEAQDHKDWIIYNSRSDTEWLPLSGQAAQSYTANGTFTYETDTLTLNTASSDFVCQGPEVGPPDVFTVIWQSATEVVLEESDGYQMTWTRTDGTIGDILGTWQMIEGVNSFEMTFSSDGSFVFTGNIADCDEGDDEGPETYSVWTGVSRTMTAAGITDTKVLHFHLWAPTGTVTQIQVSGPSLQNPVTFTQYSTYLRGDVMVDDFTQEIPITIAPNVGDTYNFTVTKSDSTTQNLSQTLGEVILDAPQITSPTGHTLADANLGNPLNITWTLPTGMTGDGIMIQGGVCAADSSESASGTVTNATSGTITLPNPAGASGAYIDVRVHHGDHVFSNTKYDFGTCDYTPDLSPPSVPAGLTATAVSSGQIDLSWTPSTDNVGVEGYKVYRDGFEIGTTVTESFSDYELTAYTSYCYTVKAYDRANNFSDQSSQACTTTYPAFGAYSFHNPDGYFISVCVGDTSEIFSAVTVSGPGLTGDVSLIYSNGRWEINPVTLGATLPTEPRTYYFTATPAAGGDPVTGSVTVSVYVEPFADNLQPTGNVTTAQPTFSWTGFTEANYYTVMVGDLSYNWIWSSPILQPDQTSAVYAGPALTAGETYRFMVISTITTDGNRNSSFAEAQFTYTVPTAEASISGTIDAGTSGYTSGDIYVSVYDAPWPNGTRLAYTVIPAPGTYTISNLPADTNLYAYARWDKDGSTTRTPGDWTGQYAANPVIITGGFNPTDIHITLTNEIPAGDILTGTWGVLHLQYEKTPHTWYSESSRVTFNGDGTGILSGMKNDEMNWGTPNQITSFGFGFTYTVSPNPDGSLNLEMTVGTETFTQRVIVSDNGNMAIQDGTGNPDWLTLSTIIRIDTAKTYSNADLNGDYYAIGYERNRDTTNEDDPPNGNGAYMAISSVETFNTGTYNYYGYANSIKSDGSVTIWNDTGLGTDGAYAVAADGMVSVQGGAFRGYLTGNSAVGIGSGSFAAEGPGTWVQYAYLKKGDRSYSTADIAGTWALVGFGDDNDSAQVFAADIGTMTCDASGQCSYKFKRSGSDGSTSINSGNVTIAVAADGSFGMSLPGSQSYAGAIGNDGNTMIFNMSFDPNMPWHRQIFIGVRASQVGDLAGTVSDEADQNEIRANFDSMVAAFNSQNIDQFMSFVSANYLDDGMTWDDFRSELLAEFGNILPTFTMTVNISGSTATAVVNWADGDSETLHWLKEDDSVWRVYGNQQIFDVEAWSGHTPNSYWVSMMVEDPNGTITSVSVTGPGISGSINLVPDTQNHWVSWNMEPPYTNFGPEFGITPPTPPLTYTFTITDSQGTTTATTTVYSYVQSFAQPVSPANGETLSELTSFSWTGIGAGYSYRIELSDSNWQRLWDSDDTTGTSLLYTGPALTSGLYYYNLQVLDGDDNFSMISVPFSLSTVPPKGDVSGDGNVNIADAILAMQAMIGLPGGLSLDGDVNSDGRIGMAEAVYILQHEAGLR